MDGSSNIVRFERSARGDWRFWALLAFGAVFAYGGLTIDPATNCNESGECAPILVPIAAGIGLLAILGALVQLTANPSRGSVLDFGNGQLTWWQNRTMRSLGDGGMIALQDISLLRIRKAGDGADIVSLFDRHGERLPFFDGEVIHWRQDEWAKQLVAACPHITFDVVD